MRSLFSLGTASTFVLPIVSTLSLPNSPALANPDQDCREYTTDITIDGQPRPAHGVACLQPDGTWRITQDATQAPTETYTVPPSAYPTYSGYPAYA
jgi:hypothetical protein